MGTDGKVRLAPGSKIKVEYKLNVNVPLPSAFDVKINVEKKILWGHMTMCSFLSGLWLVKFKTYLILYVVVGPKLNGLFMSQIFLFFINIKTFLHISTDKH